MSIETNDLQTARGALTGLALRTNILIVDDEPKNLTVLETVLDDPCYRLVRAESADEALLALMAEEFALLILDIRMPGMSGFELAQTIKQRKKTANVPIIFLTAYLGEDEQMLEGYGTGAVDYLHKPVNAAVLRSKAAVFVQLHRNSRALELANRALLAEVGERRRVEALLRELNESLDQRVVDRTHALHASDERLRLATEAVELGIWSWDLSGDKLTWENEWPYQVLGVPRDQPPVTMARLASDFVHADDLAAFEQAVGVTLRHGTPFNFEGRFRRTDGMFRSIEFAGRPLAGHGAPEADFRMIGIVRDITPRMLAQTALRESEKRYRNLFNSIDEAFCVLEMLVSPRSDAGPDHAEIDFVLMEVNPAFERQSGLSNVLGKRLRELISDIDTHWIEALQSVALSGTPTRLVRQVSTQESQWLDAFAFRLDEAGSRSIAVLFTNVTHRQRTDEALRERERLLSTATAASRVGLVVVGPDYLYRYANEAYAQLLQLPAGQIIGLPVHEVMADGWTQTKAYLDRAFAGERVAFEMTLPADSAGGGLRYFSGFYEPHTDDHGQPAVVAVVVDVSDLKRMEMRLRDADAKKDDFLATLAHELRNPLAPVRNAVRLLELKGPKTTEFSWAYGVIDRQMRAMTRLIEDLMDVSRINQGKLEMRLERVDLASVLRGAVESSQPLIDECQHHLELQLPDAPVLLDADPARLSQVFMNLLNNAAKYMNQGGRIELTVQVKSKDVVVTVKDDGIGIAADRLHGVFEMFSQIEAALTRSRGGLGIGLSLTRRLIQMHGGTIEARSPGVGHGSEFVVRLPLAGQQQLPTPEDSPDTDVALPPTSALRILLADDNEDAAATLAMLLELMGHEVRSVHDGSAAVEVAAAFSPDVILLDIGMPKLNGYEACRQMRAQAGGSEPVFIAVTGWGQAEDRLRSRAAGFDHHLVKPVEPQVLTDLIAALAAQRAAQPEQA